MILMPDGYMEFLDEKDLKKIKEIVEKKVPQTLINSVVESRCRIYRDAFREDYDVEIRSYPLDNIILIDDLLRVLTGKKNIESENLKMKNQVQELDKIKEAAKILKGME